MAWRNGLRTQKTFGTRAAIFAVLSVLALSGPLTATAADDDETGQPGDVNDTSAGNLFSDLPPTFLGNARANGLADLTQCFMNMASGAVGSMADPAVAGGGLQALLGSVGGNWTGPACPEAPEINADPSCRDVTVGGKFDPNKLKTLKKNMDAARGALACQKGKMASIQSELQCVQRNAKTLTDQIGQMQQAYQQNISQMQQYVGKLKDHIAGRLAQKEEVLTYLNGDEKNGRQGLLGLEAETENLMNNIPATIQQHEEQFRGIEQQERSLEEAVQISTSAKARECFLNRKQPTYKCGPNLPPTTAKAYLLCRYEQEMHRTPSGRLERRDQALNSVALARKQALETLLDQIFGDAPSKDQIPTASGGDQAQFFKNTEEFANQPLGVMSLADVQSQYGNSLQGFNANGIDVQGFVMKLMGSCFQRAEAEIRRERRRESTTLGRMEYALKQSRRAARTAVNQAMNDLSQKFGRIVRALGGQNIPLDTNACANARPTVQIGCLRDIENNFRGLLNGTTENSNFSLNISGSSAAPGFNFECAGLKGCIATLQRIDRNMQTEIVALDRKKAEDIRGFNISVDNFTSQMANGFSGMSKMLDDRLQKMNAALASMGISPGVSVSRVTPCPMQPDPGADGLYAPPMDMMCLIGGRMTPPMLDFGQDNFATALAGIADKAKEANTKLTQVQVAVGVIGGLAEQCGTEEIQKEEQEFHRLLSQWNTSNCNYARQHCGPDANAPISNLVSTLNDVNTDSSYTMDSDPLFSLSSGVSGLCAGSEEVFGDTSDPDRGPASTAKLEILARGLGPEISSNDPAVLGAGQNASGAGCKEPSQITGRVANVTEDSTVDAIRNECRPLLEMPNESACAASARQWKSVYRGCLENAKNDALAMVKTQEKLTGEHRVNAGTCAGLYHDIEGRAQKIADAQRRIGIGQGASDAF